MQTNTTITTKRVRRRDVARAMSMIGITPWLSLLAIVISPIPGLPELLQFNRAAIGRGELWRLVSGNFAHWNSNHLCWDAVMFLVLGVAVEARRKDTFAIDLLLSSLAVSAAVWRYCPETVLYRGLSGIDSALFVLLATSLALEARRDHKRRQFVAALVLLLGFAAKIGYELATQQTLFVDSSVTTFVPLVETHLAGAIAGALLAVMSLNFPVVFVRRLARR